MNKKDLNRFQLFLPLIFLMVLITLGLVIGPLVFDMPAMPLEILFFLASAFTIAHFLFLGFKWNELQEAILQKIVKGFPVIMIFFSIGILIGSWVLSGTIPMLVYYGISFIDVNYIYLIAFIVPIVFSLLTGTSWGSAATIGIVIMGIASVSGVHLGITAGAIIGGSYFGDKLSPLSDTTNIASIATDVKLFDHISSMLYTTLPSAIVAAIIYFIMSFVYPPVQTTGNLTMTADTLQAIDTLFEFNLLLIIPPVIVLWGSIRKKATVPTMIFSAFSACVLALIFQPYTWTDMISTLAHGYNVSMAPWAEGLPENVSILFNRGGIYELNEAIMFTFMVFIFTGVLDKVDAMPTFVGMIFGNIKHRWQVIVSSLLGTGITNAMTSNQHATSFIIGDAFKSQYDRLNVSRRVLSRSIEDYGTMIETLVPWTTSTLFMVGTLGVAWADYWHWQLMSLVNIFVAPLLAILGIGLFYKKGDR